MLLILLLTLINYSLETWKWKLLNPIKHLNFAHYFKALLSGAAISVFLPFRTGEYLGRLMHFKKKNWPVVVLGSIRAGLLQLMMTIVFGMIACFYIIPKIVFILKIDIAYLILLGAVIFLGLVLLSFQLPRLVEYAAKRFHLKQFNTQDTKSFVLPLILSILRYLVFTTQYIILLDFFGVVDYSDALILVPVFLLIQTVVPTMFLSEIGLRIVLSTYLFDSDTVIIPIFFIYLFNIILPAFIGVFFIKKWN